MAEGIRVIRDKAGTAALANVEGMPARLTDRGGHFGDIIVRQRGSDVLDVPVAADGALAHRVAGADAGGADRVGHVLVLTLGGAGLFHIAAAFTDFQHFAVCFAGGVTDDSALVGVAKLRGVVAFFGAPAVYADVAVIAESEAGCVHAVQQYPVMVISAGIIGATVPAAVAVTGTVRVAAAAGTVAGGRIVEIDISDAVFRHVGVLVGVGDFIVHGVAARLGVVGGAGQRAAIRAVSIADLCGDAGFREVGDGDGVGLAVYGAVVVGNHGLGSGVAGHGVVTEGAALHLHKAPVCNLGTNGALHRVALQRAVFLAMGAVAETAVGAAGDGLGVVGVVRVLVGHGFVQVLHELGGTVVEDVDVLAIVIGVLAAVGVYDAAGFTAGFRPMKARVCRIDAGGAIQNGALGFTICHRTV